MKNYVIYTDGAYSSARNKGGVGIVELLNDKVIRQYSNSFFNVTNNQMELIGVIIALRLIKSKFDSLTIISDSQYVISTITKYWKRRKNIRLWAKLDIELNRVKEINDNIKFSWVKGHNGNKYNELCDFYATEATK